MRGRGAGGNFANDSRVSRHKTKKKRSHDFENLELVMSRGFVSAGGTNWDPILSQGQKISSFGGSNREEIRIMIQ